MFGAGEKYHVEFTPELQRAYFEIQKLRIQSARQIIDEVRPQHKENAFIAYLDNYADLHYLLISEDKKSYQLLLKKEDLRLDEINKLPDQSPYKRFFLGEIRLHWAFAKIKFGNEISGAWDIVKAYRLLAENQRKFPNFRPTLKTLGLLHILIGSAPDQYTWVTKILGLKGDIGMGVEEIRTVIRDEPFFRQEAQLIDLLIHAYTLKLSETQLNKVKQLPREQPDNLLLHFFATTILMKESKSEEAQWYLNHAPEGPNYISFPFLEYLKGEIMLQKGNYKEAADFYTLFLKKYKGFNYIKDTHLKLFMCYWLTGNDSAGLTYLNRVDKEGSSVLEADKFATQVAADYKAGKITPRQKILYKARYASDGGYLDEAWEMLSTVTESSFNTTYDKAEFNYRKGRILQKNNRTDAATISYQRTLLLATGSSAGFGASSALQLGYIFMEKKENTKAAGYFQKAISYKNHEHKNSIDNKARAALTELGR
ncbi:hypothetical protein DYBT9275_02936 [Dyadobacter sp. CECT 9275]|uniref:Tetratricopeptide repeat protein n=2 Tax=Dyadobacter helix TaxID=2822344 RepID=A0A916JCI6_9BACT|nr:hypothetical protein DYBT9275_02936 [Dyadobacter sp. CECT 9275]